VKETGKVAAKDVTIKESGTGTGCAFCTRYRGRKVATAINA
jgi:hypothetical protein